LSLSRIEEPLSNKQSLSVNQRKSMKRILNCEKSYLIKLEKS
jgi:hypothetical protein